MPRFPRDAARATQARAFTLVELFVVISIIALLIGILVPTLGNARMNAKKVRDLAVARQLKIAYINHAEDHKSMVLFGFLRNDPVTGNPVMARDASGNPISGLAAQRYPWRLLPYLDFKSSFLYQNLNDYEDVFLDPSFDFSYQLSASPSFGLNQGFIGGSSDSDGTPSIEHPRTAPAFGSSWYVRRITDPPHPERLITFASAFGRSSTIYSEDLKGNYKVTPPFIHTRAWQTEPADEQLESSGQVGNVDLRYGGLAVVGFFDGHADTLDWDQLQDMRHWAPMADTEDWTLQPR